MKNIFETLHLRKPRTPKSAAIDGGGPDDWEGTQVTLNGWSSLVNGDVGPAVSEQVDTVFGGFGASVGEDVDLTQLPTRGSNDMGLFLDDLDINSTAPSSPNVSYGGLQQGYFSDMGISEGEFPVGAEQDFREHEAGGIPQELNQAYPSDSDKNRALAELFAADDSTQDGLENILSSFQEQRTRAEDRDSNAAASYDGDFFNGTQAKQEYQDRLFGDANTAADAEAFLGSAYPTSQPMRNVLERADLYGTLNVLDSGVRTDFTKHQDSLPRVSAFTPKFPYQAGVSVLPPGTGPNNPDDLCSKIATALAQKGVRGNGLWLVPPGLKPTSHPGNPKPHPSNPTDPGVARSAPSSPPETPCFKRALNPSQLRRTKSVHGTPNASPRSLSPVPSTGHSSSRSPSPSAELATGQRSPKRKDNPVVRTPSPKRLNGAPEKGAPKPPGVVNGGPVQVAGSNFGAGVVRTATGEPVRVHGLYYDHEQVPHWKGPAPRKGEDGYEDYLRYRQFLSAKARDKKAALQQIEKESHVRLQGTVETLDDQLEVLVLKLQECLSHQDEEVPLREILRAAESMKQQVRQSLDWRQEQEAELLEQIEKGHGGGKDAAEYDIRRDSDELDIKIWS